MKFDVGKCAGAGLEAERGASAFCVADNGQGLRWFTMDVLLLVNFPVAMNSENQVL